MIYTFKVGEKLPITAVPNTSGVLAETFTATVTEGDGVASVELRKEELAIFVVALSTGKAIVQLAVDNTLGERLAVSVELDIEQKPATELQALVGEPVPA